MKKVTFLTGVLILAVMTMSFVSQEVVCPWGVSQEVAGQGRVSQEVVRQESVRQEGARQEDWISFEGHGYKMLFPEKPKDETRTINTALGELKMNIFMYEVQDELKDDNYTYSITEIEYPDSVINSDKKDILDKFMRNCVDGSVNSVHGKLLTETVIQLNGFPGREFRIDIKDGFAVVTMRAYLVHNTMYILQIITNAKKDFNKSLGRFMNSFTLK